MASKYTSTFLRENALHSLPDSEARKLDAPSSSELYQMVAEMLESSRLESGHRKFDPLNGHLYTLIDARMPIDEGQVLGTCYWEETAQEPGTVWPHLSKVPSLVTVDTMNQMPGGGPAELSVVDTRKALTDMRKWFPVEFDFLAGCVLEYEDGPFRSAHPICKMDTEQGEAEIVPGVFNNAARSSAITVQSLDRLYESLQKFGRVCAQNTHFLRLKPGQRLLFNNAAGMLGAPAQRGRVLALKCYA